MPEVFKGETVYMTFPHTRTGAVRGDFTFTLIVDGVVRTDVSVELVEVKQYHYVASFETTSADDNSYWYLHAIDNSDTTREYLEEWRIRSRAIENNIKQIRSRQDSEGGFFKGTKEE